MNYYVHDVYLHEVSMHPDYNPRSFTSDSTTFAVHTVDQKFQDVRPPYVVKTAMRTTQKLYRPHT